MASGYYFFLSYARGDRDIDAHGTIVKFHQDLVAEICHRRGLDHDGIGFFDAKDIEPGERWPNELADALRTSRAFVPILSARYFNRPYCGKEWAVFSQRLGQERPPLIQPVLFSSPQDLRPLPRAVAPIQYTHASFPEAYGEEGLRHLVRLTEHKDNYQKFVEAFAKRLISVVEAHPLAAATSIPGLDAVGSAFHQPGTQLAAMVPEGPLDGPRFVQFVFVAATRAELRHLRQSLDCYGDEGGFDWKPYLPDLSDEVAIIAQDVASREKLRYEALPLGADLIGRLEDALDRQKIVVVIVDTWTMRLAQYTALMRQLDSRHFRHCVIVIPWNERDPETAGSREVLRFAVIDAFANKTAMPDPDAFVDSIHSADELKVELAVRLNRARARILHIEEQRRRGGSDRVFHRRAESNRVFPKPELVTGDRQ